MTSDQYARAKQIFLEACALAERDRPSFVSEACGGDAVILKEVERLLAHHLPLPLPAGTNRNPARPSLNQPDSIAPGLPTYQTGDFVTQRYRIVSLLGEGGMGRVYRAEDLKLHLNVALKFLSKVYVSDPKWRRRLQSEVKLARQVGHPNICRVYDLAGSDDAPFISMEYIDGENLASLLRRVGRLTGLRAIDMARQMCAGLAAAHIHGVLHRDLKPANVMIDQKGRVRITDFGLAVVTGQIEQREIRAGTPRYMAPEQLAGVTASEKSDIYSLGLVLYEMFTGRPAFDANNVADYLNIHLTIEPIPPSTLVPEIDPKVEAVILACLQKDPDDRPESALNVAAALPGGDILAAALDAGQIPTRDMLATAAAQGSISRRHMYKVAGASLALFLVAVLLGHKTHPIAKGGGTKSPEVLFEKAQEILRLAGRTPAPDLSDGRYYSATDAESQTGDSIMSFNGLSIATPADMELIYYYREYPPDRQSPDNDVLTFIMPRSDSPRLDFAADSKAHIVLDGQGRLLLFKATPQADREIRPVGQLDWQSMILAAGFNPQDLVHLPATPTPPTIGASGQLAFEVPFEGQSGRKVRIEIEKIDDQLCYFGVLRELPPSANSISITTMSRWINIRAVRNFVMLVLLAAAIPGAWNNLKRRGDLTGAMRLGGFTFALRLLSSLLSARGMKGFSEAIDALAHEAVSAVCEGSIVALFYFALESHIRRLWPRTLGCWSRLLNGILHDPFVGRDVLVGCMVGNFWAILLFIDRRLPEAMGWHSRTQLRLVEGYEELFGARFAVAGVLNSLQSGVYQGLVMVFILVIATRLVGSRRWLSLLIAWLVGAAMYAPAASHPVTACILFAPGIVAFGLYLLAHWGLVSLVSAILVAGLLSDFPITTDFGKWFASYGVLAGATTVGLALWSLYEATRTPAPNIDSLANR